MVGSSVLLRPRAREVEDPAAGPCSTCFPRPRPSHTPSHSTSHPLHRCSVLPCGPVAGSWGGFGTPLHSLHLCSCCCAECQVPGSPRSLVTRVCAPYSATQLRHSTLWRRQASPGLVTHWLRFWAIANPLYQPQFTIWPTGQNGYLQGGCQEAHAVQK